jgi:hypothetical protein
MGLLRRKLTAWFQSSGFPDLLHLKRFAFDGIRFAENSHRQARSPASGWEADCSLDPRWDRIRYRIWGEKGRWKNAT